MIYYSTFYNIVNIIVRYFSIYHSGIPILPFSLLSSPLSLVILFPLSAKLSLSLSLSQSHCSNFSPSFSSFPLTFCLSHFPLSLSLASIRTSLSLSLTLLFCLSLSVSLSVPHSPFLSLSLSVPHSPFLSLSFSLSLSDRKSVV